jgi:hypothetical protein
MAELLGMTHTELVEVFIVGLLVLNITILWDIRNQVKNFRDNMVFRH